MKDDLTFSWVPHSPCKSFPVQGLCWKCRLPVVLCNPERTSDQALLNSKVKQIIHVHTGWPCTCWSPILSLLSWSWRSRDIHSFSVFCLYYNQSQQHKNIQKPFFSDGSYFHLLFSKDRFLWAALTIAWSVNRTRWKEINTSANFARRQFKINKVRNK